MRKRKVPSQRLRSIYRLDLPGKRMDGWQVHITRNRRTFQKIHPPAAPRADARIAQVHVGDKRLSVTLRIAPDERAIEWPALGLRYVLQELLAAKL